MNNIWVDADMIWTPRLYVSNRAQDFGPQEEVQLRCNIEYDGLVSCYRSLRKGLQQSVVEPCQANLRLEIKIVGQITNNRFKSPT